MTTRMVHIDFRCLFDLPEKTTHYQVGLDRPGPFQATAVVVAYLYKNIGVVGDHWWKYDEEANAWKFVGHTRPLGELVEL